MTGLSIFPGRKTWISGATFVLLLILANNGLISESVQAQEPGEPAPTNSGYLHIHVYDDLTQSPIDGRQISIYNRTGDLVTQATTTCQGYVAFENVPTGAYRIDLEPDPNWYTRRRYHDPGGRNTPAEWVWVRTNQRVGVRFYERPNALGAGLRVSALNSNSRHANQPREPLPNIAFTVYDTGGNNIATGHTGCGGFVDFNHIGAGTYRVTLADQLTGVYVYPSTGERWITTLPGRLTDIWFFTVPNTAPQIPSEPPS